MCNYGIFRMKALILAFNNKITSKVISSENPVLKANLKDFSQTKINQTQIWYDKFN